MRIEGPRVSEKIPQLACMVAKVAWKRQTKNAAQTSWQAYEPTEWITPKRDLILVPASVRLLHVGAAQHGRATPMTIVLIIG